MYNLSKLAINQRTGQKMSLGAPLVVALSLAVTGCAVNGNALPDITNGDQLVTHSVVNKNKPAGIEKADAEVIKTTVVSASTEPKPLAWTNPQTGSSGAIVAIDNFMGKHGQQCRGFKTSVANFMGIAYYNGETCQVSGENWVLSWFKAAN